MSTTAASFRDAEYTSEQTQPSLSRNVSWTLAGNVIYSLCQWAMLSVLAKRGTPDAVGVFALGLAVTAPVFMFTNLQLRTVQATDTGKLSGFGNFFVLRCAGSFVAFLAVLGLCWVTGYHGRTLAVIICLALAKALESIEDIIIGLLQKHERLDLAARALSLRGLLSFAIFALVFEQTRRVDLACASLVISWAVVVLLYDMSLARNSFATVDGFWRSNRRSIWQLIKTSLPLGVVMMLISLNANIPRYILERYLGRGELGIFVSLAYVLTAANILILALGQSASARLARMFACGDLVQFRDVLLKMIGFGVLIGVGCFLFALLLGDRFLLLVYGPAYAAQRSLLLWLSGTVGLSAVASFLGFAVTAAQCFRPQLPVIAAMTFTTWAASWLLVPRLGLTGAAIALLISAAVQLVGLTMILQRVLHQRSETA